MDITKLQKIITAAGKPELLEDLEVIREGKQARTLRLATLQKPGEKNPGTWKVIDKKEI